MKFTSGIGYDIHAFQQGRRLFLGGVEIPAERGLAGHSDADVLLHAVCDAILGAAGEGDLGRHYPDTDPKFEGISSRRLLEEVAARVRAGGHEIVHLDAVVITEEPRLAPFLPQIRSSIAKGAGIPESSVNVKAKTNEKLGPVGRGEGMAAQAIASLRKEDGQ
jgi:2-C-methyl-D-erythritol 2,4-cyclodiphosphate synthase